ncbi:MAG: flavin reductase family protein [Flavobacterium sp.]|uniref:flavin reductase family protein n=1 Tax=Flavobacterium sp. TaxID=239 RepID=UPI0011FF64A3|nr:flavin reductase family protein [Flavobacterium sp.]RZJ68652.1 MAG: flavin reductase family protein [Flavobacterium sp.]
MKPMKRTYKKHDFPVSGIRKFLEPGPIVLVSSHHAGKNNIMTMGWHTVMEFTPSLIGCMITAANHSFEMIQKSGECVINIPTVDYLEEVIQIGNSSGKEIDKFKEFNLTAEEAQNIKAPLIKECFANFECKIHDTKMLNDYNFFVLEVVKAHVATFPKYPKTVHYRGEGVFMISGKNVDHHKKFKRQNL